MRLQVRRVDHDPVGLSGLASQFDKDAIEHAHVAPADEPIVDCLRRPVSPGRIAPPQAVLDDEDDRRHNQPVTNPRNTVR